MSTHLDHGPHIAFGGDPTRRAVLLARIEEHRAAGTITTGGESWTGAGGTVAGCLAEDNDPAVFARVTGFPAALMPLLEILGAHAADVAIAAGIAAAWLGAAHPRADLSAAPSRILLALLAAAPLPETEPDMAAAWVAVAGLHRRVASGDWPDRAAWRRVRAVAVAATDNARGAVGRRCGRLIEAAAWDPLSAPNTLREVAAEYLEVRAAEASAATGWTEADDAAVERCFQTYRRERLDAGVAPEDFRFPPLFEAREPALAQRFLAQLAASNRAHQRAAEDLAALCLAAFRAVAVPGVPSAA